MELTKLIHAEIDRALVGGPTYVRLWLIDCSFDLIAMHDRFYSALWHDRSYSLIVR